MKKLNIISIAVFMISIVTTQAQNSSLDRYISIALDNHFGVQAATQNIQVQAAGKKEIQGEGISSFDVMYGYGALPIETKNGPINHKVSAGVMFPWFGTRNQKYEVVNQKVAIAEANKEDTENVVKYKVRALYFQLLQNSKDLKSAAENVAILKSFESVAYTQYENSKGSMVDILRVQMEIEEAKNKVKTLQQDSVLLQQNFSLLLNKEIEKIVLIDSVSFFKNNDTVDENPILKSLNATQNMYAEKIKVVQKSSAPQIKLSIDYSILGSAQGVSSENSGKNGIMPMIGLSIPLFNAKKYSGQKEQLQLSNQEVALRKEDTKKRLQIEYLTAKNQYNDAKREFDLIGKQLIQIDQAIQIQQEAYAVSNSQGSAFVELLRLQLQKLDFQFREHKSKATELEALAKINYITGL
ncbi:TolC family protein [Flammeovirga kamogawensis]|uniref:TolC family protein n=1 Tax=Flammeovirga kamogawensis TaxID=373891 RepID=A0ABX8GWN4_9BACT|nr:TolC family protein [Flammeovirga kamogawensis]MBB6461244.1 outer membrane protein TolC [Flammeovirga kamogawensis]QWG07803.1 TolC family protein [Flammeovirga kamogawensis]TRX69609.1 TolC family protein [Flammeovirga kamogawensis]